MNTSIRLIAPEDMDAVIALVIEAGLFPATETAFLSRMLTDYFDGHASGYISVVDEERVLRGVAYHVPAPATEGTWYLTMIAVHPVTQRQGQGTLLLNHVENEVRAQGRTLLVETSGVPEYDQARSFYTKCGYQQEARIRDYYDTGNDMVRFRKVLNQK